MTPKATHYIEQLDKARCEGDWQAVPELVRKVRKHAPNRSCLALTAETECAISRATAGSVAAIDSDTSARPPTGKDLQISTQMPKLLTALEEEKDYAEDRFQAQVCIGWLHWVVAEYSLASVRLPKSLNPEDTELDPAHSVSEWTTVCSVKAAYIKANCLTRTFQRVDALAAFRSGLPSLARVWSGQSMGKQLRYWAELFLTEYCRLAGKMLEENEVSLEDPNALDCFRAWARFWETTSTQIAGGYGFKGAVPRRKIWTEYYVALSKILEQDLPLPSGGSMQTDSDLSARGRLRVELKTTEAAYQRLLLNETDFPRADEERAEVEAFVKLAVKNWSILCGRGWKERDLGASGRAGISRGLIETLYSAATRTYHSTAILRSLFVAHLAVADFDLAFKAFDSYLDLVKKAKARVAKTGQLEPNLDKDGDILETMSQCIIARCRYGHADSASKARQLGAELEDWLSKLPQFRGQDNGATLPTHQEETNDVRSPVPAHVLALSWQAIGLAHAHWSRATHEASYRPEIQSKAIRCLRRSLASEFGRSKDIRSFFALALLLAERRELPAAVEVVKTALMAANGQHESYHLLYGPYWQERSLIPMWHLLALLLSARQDYVLAAKACEGALEQFKDPAVLFGTADQSFRSEHLNEAGTKDQTAASSGGLIEEMDDAEKESILEVKMTQLALVELIEGSEVAVNASYELLTLFSKLFGSISAQPTLHTPSNASPVPPKTSGTLRSIKGSIFGNRSDRSRPPTRQPSVATMSEKSETPLPQRPATSQTVTSAAPTIQVTGDGAARQGSMSTQRSGSRQRNSLKKRDRSSGRNRPASAGGLSHQATIVDGEPYFSPSTEPTQADFFGNAGKRQTSFSSSFSSRGKTLPTMDSYLSTNSEFSDINAETTFTSLDLLPVVQFSKEKGRIQRSTILIRVWLTIAGLYRRAGILDDCKDAIAEAQKLAQALEADLTKDPSGSGGLRGPEWAETKTVEDLLGDIWSEVGLLSLAKGLPYEARAEFESALTHSPDHPAATVGLSNILLDIYCEKLLPLPTIPSPESVSKDIKTTQQNKLHPSGISQPATITTSLLPSLPLGLGASSSLSSSPPFTAPNSLPSTKQEEKTLSPRDGDNDNGKNEDDSLPAPYNATHLPLLDRLAARDRAYTLLSGLTRLGTGWNYSEAWFALARAYEESGQPDKAKDVLWWCVELEESAGARDWRCLGSGGGYVI